MSALRISVPGRALRLVEEPDPLPWNRLTPWQRTVVLAVLARNGNRSAAARDLGTSVANVQCAVRRAVARGTRIPTGARRGRDLRPRSRQQRHRRGPWTPEMLAKAAATRARNRAIAS